MPRIENDMRPAIALALIIVLALASAFYLYVILPVMLLGFGMADSNDGSLRFWLINAMIMGAPAVVVLAPAWWFVLTRSGWLRDKDPADP